MIKIYNKNGVILNTQDKYCAENIEVAIDTTDLTPENIVKGKRILGVDGTAEAGSGEIPEGYIKPEGTIAITENGTVDVTSYASAEISVPIPDGYILPSGNFEITANGDYDISDKESVSVNVAGSGEGDSLWTEVMEGKLAKQDMSYGLYCLVADSPDKYLQGFDTGKVTLMDHLFEYSTITSFSTFDTSAATSMKFFCAYCSKLTDVPALDIGKVTTVSHLFYFCSNLKKLPNWDFSKVKEFNSAFSNTKIEEAVIDTSSATDIGYMFQSCSYLKRAEISTMDKLTSQYNVSSYCKSCYSLKQFIIRNMTKVPVFYNSSYAYPFVDCYHFTGGYHQIYNPEALQDGGIYVPDEWVEPMKAATGWSIYGDVIYPLSQLPDSWEPDIPYITAIDRASTSYSTWTVTSDGKYYYGNSYQPLCKFTFIVPENATSNTLTYEVEIAGSDSQRPYTVFFGKLDTVVNNYVTPDGCIDYKEYPEAQTYTVTYTDLTPGEHFIYIGANQRQGSGTAQQFFKFRRVYE